MSKMAVFGSLISCFLITSLSAQASSPPAELVYGLEQFTMSLTAEVTAQAVVENVPGIGTGFHLVSDVYNWPQLRAAAIVDWQDANATVDSVTFQFRRNKEGFNRATTFPVIRLKVSDTATASARTNPPQPRYLTITSDQYKMEDLGNGWTKATYTFAQKVTLYQLAVCCYEENQVGPFIIYGNFDLVDLEITARNADGSYVAKPAIDTKIRRVNLFGGESPEIVEFSISARHARR